MVHPNPLIRATHAGFSPQRRSTMVSVARWAIHPTNRFLMESVSATERRRGVFALPALSSARGTIAAPSRRRRPGGTTVWSPLSSAMGTAVSPLAFVLPGRTYQSAAPQSSFTRLSIWNEEPTDPSREWPATIPELPGGLVLHESIMVRMSVEHGEYVADAGALNVYAFGSTQGEARERLGSRIVEQYQRLNDLSGRLAPPMQAIAQRLRAIILPGDA